MTGLSTLSLCMGAFSVLALCIWLFLYFAGLKYKSFFEVLDEKAYPFKDLYGIGYAWLTMNHYSFTKKKDRKLRQELEVLHGSKYCDYYLRVVRSQQVTYAVTLGVVAFSLYGLTMEVLAFVIGIVFAVAAYSNFGDVPKKQIQKRSEELLRDFSEVVSKLALLTNAGMIFREAWQEVAAGGEGTIYQEMRLAVEEMNNGFSETDALYNFSNRCVIPEIKKFTSTIIQSITKGNSELTLMMQQQSKEVWQMKKQLVRRAGEKAASKLLIPICIMFLGILIMTLIPIFTNLGA